MNERLWQIWIDTGGTFTDCLATDPSGESRRAKVLSSSALRATVAAVDAPRRLRIREDWGAGPGVVDGMRVRPVGAADQGARVAAYDPRTGLLELDRPLAGIAPGTALEVQSAEEAPILAARLVTGTPAGSPLPPLAMRLATTRGTNALLERRGARTALFITRGFGDLPRIGTQQRPDLFALDVHRPEPLHEAAVEVEERRCADGTVLLPLDLDGVRAHAARLASEGVRSAAVALMHSFRDPAHERAVADAVREAGFEHVAVSAGLAGSIGLLARTETAIVDGYLGPVIGGYLNGVRGALGGGRLHVMTSAGGLVRPEDFRAKDSLLSGPAGGVVGAVLAGRRSGWQRVIAFDMGGTSTDVARVDGDFEYVWEHEVAGARIVAPALAIESVAAGGGSICTVDAQGLRVGPESAGASPGPACYGAGGPLTVTDCNLLLGRLDPARFAIPVDAEPARAAADELAARVHTQTGERVDREALLAGLLEIADERMADAIRGISLRRGYDPAEYALVAFGGAGAQHGCGVAARLGMRTVIVPADAGLLSALGIGHAALERVAERQVLRPLDEVGAGLDDLFAALAEDASSAVAREGVAPERIHVRRRIANLRYAGQDATLQIDVAPGANPRSAFEDRYASIYGHRPVERPIEVESIRVLAATLPATVERAEAAKAHAAVPADHRRMWMGNGWTEVAVYERATLLPGARVPGPALIAEQHSATHVAAGWSGEIDAAGNIILRHEPADAAAREERSEIPQSGVRPSTSHPSSAPESVRAELFISRFRALVSEMGEMLRRTALSTNVKERLDFSCALLDADAELVVNAPHIPVHLGAMGLCVRAVRDAIRMDPGDVIVTNHPGFGGSHLPDVTVITPVHDSGGTLIGYVASRAHHAEIGGTRPGSMPPAARTLAEEGVVIRPMHLVRGGEARWDEMRAVLSGGVHPTRALDDNLADLAAAVAANHRGAEMLRALAGQHGRDAIAGYMAALKQRAERGVRSALSALPDGVYEAEERLDDGSPLRVRITVRGDEAEVDFGGSAAVHPGNLNATPAIVRSVVLYVLRLLVRDALPLNEGLMRPVRLTVPPGLLNPPFGDDASRDPAVVGGNTEVSQRLVDTLIRALRLSACSQGTMNNVLWGSDRFGYYETVCGGCGAGPTWNGAHATHSHMTNTRITDPEVVEHRYPVRVERFAIRAGSGGAGARRGGDGAVREFTFLAPMSLSVLTQHRTEGPFGMEGGHPGAPGRQTLIRASGESVALAPVDGVDVHPGDRLVLETPGGGGWGAPEPSGLR